MFTKFADKVEKLCKFPRIYSYTELRIAYQSGQSAEKFAKDQDVKAVELQKDLDNWKYHQVHGQLDQWISETFR